MAGNHEMKELKEAVLAGKEVVEFVVTRFKDGADFGDAVAIVKTLLIDSEFRNKLIAGGKGAEKIPQEFKNELEVDGIDGLINELLDIGGTLIS